MSLDVALQPLVLTAKQAGRLLALSEREVRRLAEANLIGCFTVGTSEGRYRFSPAHIDAYLKKQERLPKGVKASSTMISAEQGIRTVRRSKHF